MIELQLHDHPYATLVRPIKLQPGWSDLSTVATTAARLAGPIVLDVHDSLDRKDDLIPVLIAEAEHAARHLKFYNIAQLHELRSAAWRGAHRFMVDNPDGIDRGREINELAKLLGIERK